MSTFRFPGVSSFEDDVVSRALFFGREEESIKLLHFILSENLVILFSKSGLGKSSLLKARIFEDLRSNNFYPVLIRLNQKEHSPQGLIRLRIGEVSEMAGYEIIASPYKSREMEPAASTTPPADNPQRPGITGAETAPADPVEKETENVEPASLTDFLLGKEIWSPDNKLLTPVIVLDQFEEIFTLKHNLKYQHGFFVELAHIINEVKAGNLNTKIVIAIREDFLGHLEKLATKIPSIFTNRFRLEPLKINAAEEAILEPAKIELKQVNFDSPAFYFSDTARKSLLQFLSRKQINGKWEETEEIEPVQLQIICSELEERVKSGLIEPEENKIIITFEQLGGIAGMKEILANFYTKQLTKLKEEVKLDDHKILAIRNVIEKELIVGKRRVPLDYDALINKDNIDKDAIDLLISNKLLKTEKHHANSLVEISHDTLVEPILDFYEKRNAEEEKEKIRQELALEKFKAEEARKELERKAAEEKKEAERKEREKTRKRMILVLSLAAIISSFFGLWAYTQSLEAKKQAKEATKQSTEAKKLKLLADYNANTAKANEKLAMRQESLAVANAEKAEIQRDSALFFFKLAELNAARANKQTALANELASEATRQKDVSDRQLAENLVQKEYFYKSGYLDQPAKETITASLFLRPLDKTKKINLADFIHVGLLENINMATKARDTSLFNPVAGLRMADTVWRKGGRHEHVQHILSGIFKNNIFYKQKIDLLTDRYPLLAVSKDASHFAANFFEGIITGTYSHDTLKIDARNKINLSNKYYEDELLDFAFLDNNRVITLNSQGKISEWNGKESSGRTTLPEIENANIIEFSPDGKTLITTYDGGVVRLWNIAHLTNGRKPAFIEINNNVTNKNLRQIIFSPDSKRLIKLFTDRRLEVWQLDSVRRLSAFDRFAFMSAANFSADGEFIITASTSNAIYLWNSKGQRQNYLPLSSSSNYKEVVPFSATEIEGISLSGDWKTLMIHKGGAIFVAERNNRGPIFSLESGAKSSEANSLNFRKLSGSKGRTRKAMFVDNRSLISINENDFVYLWDLQQNFKNLDHALSNVRQITALTTEEKLAKGILKFKEVEASTNENTLLLAAQFYKKASVDFDADGSGRFNNLNNAKRLYSLLAQGSSDVRKAFYLGEIIAINDVFVEELDAGKNKNYQEQVNRLAENVNLCKERLRIFPKDSFLLRLLSDNYGNLAFYQLFTRNFKATIESAQAGLNAYPDNDWINTNLALGYLLSGEVGKAETIYRTYKDKIYKNKGRKFKDGFLGDFKDLEEANIITGNEPEVLKIKKLLSTNTKHENLATE